MFSEAEGSEKVQGNTSALVGHECNASNAQYTRGDRGREPIRGETYKRLNTDVRDIGGL